MNSDNIISILGFLDKPERTSVISALNSKLYLSDSKFILDIETICKIGNLEMLKYFMDINRKFILSVSIHKILRISCQYGHFEMVKFLYTCYKQELEIIKQCIDFEMDILKEQLFQSACEFGQIDVLNFILDKSRYNEPFYRFGIAHACQHGQNDAVKLLFSHEKSMHGRFDLHWFFLDACQGGNIKLIKFLVKKAKKEKTQLYFYEGMNNSSSKKIIKYLKKKERKYSPSIMWCW